MAEALITTPDILQEDLSAFHATHFSSISTEHFSEHFLGSVEDSYREDLEEEHDVLGQYPDGVKRTLTDEQIAIFRHSEIQALLRDRRHAEESRGSGSEPSIPRSEARELEDGELEDQAPEQKSQITATATPPSQNDGKLSKKERRAQNAKQRGFFKQHVKPDLRKRTWDKVDIGMDSLTYDDGPARAPTALSQASQRRRISYDDD